MNARTDGKTLPERCPVRSLLSAAAGVSLMVCLFFAAPGASFAQDCSPTGAHGKHSGFDCKTCHVVGGVVCFDPAGKAVSPLMPAPAFYPDTQTCSNVACHTVLPGTFSYYNVGGDGETTLITVNYGSTSGNTTPNWFTTTGTCGACHGNPPRYGSDGSNVWHSGYHAGGPSDPANQCQFCHPDATGQNNQGTAITNPLLHANGTVNVEAVFRSSCFSCH